MRYINVKIRKQNLDKFIIENKENLKSKFNVKDVEKEFAGNQAPALLLVDDEDNVLMEFDSVLEFEKYAGKDLDEIVAIQKEDLKLKLKSLVDKKIALFNSKYPQEEQKLFPRLIEEYGKYIDNTEAKVPTIEYFAAVQGKTKEEMVEAIGRKYKGVVTVVALRHKLEDTLESLQAIEEIEAFKREIAQLENINSFEELESFLNKGQEDEQN